MDSDDDVPIFRQFFVTVMIGSSGEKMSQPFGDVIGRADPSQARSKMNSNEQSADRGSRAADITRLYTHVCTLKLQIVSTVVPAHTNNNLDCALISGQRCISVELVGRASMSEVLEGMDLRGEPS